MCEVGRKDDSPSNQCGINSLSDKQSVNAKIDFPSHIFLCLKKKKETKRIRLHENMQSFCIYSTTTTAKSNKPLVRQQNATPTTSVRVRLCVCVSVSVGRLCVGVSLTFDTFA